MNRPSLDDAIVTTLITSTYNKRAHLRVDDYAELKQHKI